jgi:hypothetical protein
MATKKATAEKSEDVTPAKTASANTSKASSASRATPATKSGPAKPVGPAHTRSAARLLAALDAIPDDPPGSDREFMRAIDKGRPERPLFRGKY